MLFNSFTFIFLFLPVTWFGYVLLGRKSRELAALWLVVASLVFYAYWDPRYIFLLLISACFNFAASRVLVAWPQRKVLLALAVGFNLALLGYFKYANFIVANVSDVSGYAIAIRNIVLPLGISFFTFTQIAFLVDVFRREASEPKFLHYLLFVTYFPHLIAGPILHHKEMMPQFTRSETYQFNARYSAMGCVIFVIGLFKKAVLADGIAPFATTIFDATSRGMHVGIADAWGGALAYTFQLYFDFSGYCDMAVGASLLFGIVLPLNFNSPYKSLNIIDFWRRWHMTLSRFLRDYLYIPLGGNRRGRFRRYINLFVTMLLGGLWHGAGWNFLIWGGLHGVYLGINHAFDTMRNRVGLKGSGHLGTAMSWLVTFIAVVIGWVFFRSKSFHGAVQMLCDMFGLSAIVRHNVVHNIAAVEPAFRATPGHTALSWIWCIALLIVALFMPNTQEFAGFPPQAEQAERRPVSGTAQWLLFKPSRAWAIAIGAIVAIALACLPQPTDFLYFNF